MVKQDNNIIWGIMALVVIYFLYQGGYLFSVFPAPVGFQDYFNPANPNALWSYGACCEENSHSCSVGTSTRGDWSGVTSMGTPQDTGFTHSESIMGYSASSVIALPDGTVVEDYYEDEYIKLWAGSGSIGTGESYVEGDFELKPGWMTVEFEEKFNFFQSQEDTIDITVINNFPASFDHTDLRIWIDTKLPDGTSFAYDRSVVDVTIPEGESIWKVPVSTENLGEHTIYVAPVLQTGVRCTGGDRLNRCRCLRDQVYYGIRGTGEIEKKIYLVNPKPIYLPDIGSCLSNECPEGYTCQEESELCTRTDILDNQLTCQQVGCPVTPDMTWECSSAGYCVESVYQYTGCENDWDCTANTKCLFGICVNEVIYDNVVQCASADDCLVPCTGIEVSCDNNLCSYSGECDTTVIQCLSNTDCDFEVPCAGVYWGCEDTRCHLYGSCEDYYIELDCEDPEVTCPNGYKCDTSYDPAVCINEQYRLIDCLYTEIQEDDDGNEVVVYPYQCPAEYECTEMTGYNYGVCTLTRILDCQTTGCPVGYTCVENVCKSEKDTIRDCRLTGCPKDYTCSTENGWCVKGEKKDSDGGIIYDTGEKSDIPYTLILASIVIIAGIYALTKRGGK